MLRALTFDFWDTLYTGAALPERAAIRQGAVRALLGAYGRELPEPEVQRLYREAAVEAERWWRDEHRGYTTRERLHWLLRRAQVEPREDCAHVAQACAAVDDALIFLPPPLVAGAADAIRRLARRFPLAVVSDTGFASGRAQDRLLEKDGLRDAFVATIYSMEVGTAKPRPEPFRAALAAFAPLGIAPHEVLHVGDMERTDVRGALDAGMRAVRCDFVHANGPSAAERVVRSYAELVAYIEDAAAMPVTARHELGERG